MVGLAGAAQADQIPPKPLPVDPSALNAPEAYWDASSPLGYGFSKEGSAADTVWVRVHDDSSCSYTGNFIFGNRGVGTRSWATWCFDGGLGDSCSTTDQYGSGIPGCWTHYDAHVFGQSNKWHIDTYDVYQPGSQDSSMWCGEKGDTLSWEYPPGYGPGYGISCILNLGGSASFNTANGMTYCATTDVFTAFVIVSTAFRTMKRFAKTSRVVPDAVAPTFVICKACVAVPPSVVVSTRA